ncbi:MAG: hypothetical protein EHM28_03000 [Spirochaetaceae bacterium]|nr:MAG: hypothetical protein EHM28_03000 [Spirochaetaceae bacterium]
MKRTLITAVLLVLIASGGFAQQFGITASIAPLPYIGGDETFIYYNPLSLQIGMDIRILPFLTLKPGVMFFMWNNSEDDEADMLLGASLDVQYVMDWGNNFSIYIGPGVKYYQNTNWDTTGDVSDEDTAIEISIVLGGQYMLSKNFGFFADVGISYTMHTDDDSPGTDNIIKTRNAYLGVVFYF